MPGTRLRLAQAAERRFTERHGPICHDAVVEWLEDAGYITPQQITDAGLGAGAGGGEGAGVGGAAVKPHDDFLVQPDAANRVVSADACRALAQGSILGFYQQNQQGGAGRLQHSMVVIGNGFYGGANNAGVISLTVPRLPTIGANLHAVLNDSQMGWAHNMVRDYQVYCEAPDTVAARF